MERVQRWRLRLLDLRGSEDLAALLDVVLAFFVNFYHLRDWLLRSSAVTSDELDELFRTSIPLRICADIANIAKHLDLTNPPRMALQLSLAREYAPEAAAWFGNHSILVVLSAGRKHDVLALAQDCEQAWLHFLETRSLL